MKSDVCMSDLMIEIEHLHKTYRSGFTMKPKLALKDVSFKVEPGAMYQLSLNFGLADYVFAPDEAKHEVMDNAQREAEYWDGDRKSVV